MKNIVKALKELENGIESYEKAYKSLQSDEDFQDLSKSYQEIYLNKSYEMRKILVDLDMKIREMKMES